MHNSQLEPWKSLKQFVHLVSGTGTSGFGTFRTHLDPICSRHKWHTNCFYDFQGSNWELCINYHLILHPSAHRVIRNMLLRLSRYLLESVHDRHAKSQLCAHLWLVTRVRYMLTPRITCMVGVTSNMSQWILAQFGHIWVHELSTCGHFETPSWYLERRVCSPNWRSHNWSERTFYNKSASKLESAQIWHISDNSSADIRD